MYQVPFKNKLTGKLTVASDKSISHRAVIFASLAKGKSKIRNLLLGEDVLATLNIINQLGVETSHTAQNIKEGDELVIEGKGFFGLKEPIEILYCGNSGTTMRLMLGVLAGQSFSATLTGDDSLNQRPMDRVMQPLREMGADFVMEEKEGKRFITIKPKEGVEAPYLEGMDHEIEMASAQVKTALLLAGLYAKEPTSVTEPKISRNHTELMLKSMHGKIKVEERTVTINNPKKLKPLNVDIPGDLSSAAFLIVAALITPDSEITIENVNLNSTRMGLIDVLKYMGANIKIEAKDKIQGEEVGQIIVKSSKLQNISIGGNLIVRMIDEIPALAIAASHAKGKMVVKDAKELRVKETDRIQAICCELKKLGVNIAEREDGFEIIGNPEGFQVTEPVCLKSYNDHRMAMMEVIAGMRLEKGATIDDISSIKTSFPTFLELLASL